MRAIVLSRRDFREFDQIISFYTFDLGKIELLARGVKKIISKNAAHLELFSLVDIDVIKGKEINHLTKVQPIEFYKNIRENLQKNLLAGFIVSLIDKLTQVGERDERLFIDLDGWLEFINLSEDTSLILVDGFIVKLLHCLGFDILYADNIPEGFLKQKLEILSQDNWEEINNIQFTHDEYKKLNEFIHDYLVFHTEKNVNNWFWLRQFNNLLVGKAGVKI